VMTAHDYKLACPAYKMFDGRHICEDCKGGSLLPLIRKRCVHGSIAMSTFVAFESALHRFLGSYERYIDRIVCPSRFLLEKLASWGWPRERLVHIPNFVDTSRWTAQFAPGNYALYFGRLAPEKGVQTLLNACRETGCPVKIVGWGTEREALSDYALKNGVRAQFIDRLPAEELLTLIQQARCVVVPSEWYENASLAILEAFACGKPVIAARIGGNPELVHHGLNGWLFEPGNVAELSSWLRRVWDTEDPALEEMGRAARASLTQRHGADAYFESMTSLYSMHGTERSRAPIDSEAAAGHT
jgi:glycosyltransferase involved in cell wall biosynthesis